MSYSYSSAGGEDKTTTSPEKWREGVGGREGGKGVADVWGAPSHASGEVWLERKGKEVWVMWILMWRGGKYGLLQYVVALPRGPWRPCAVWAVVRALRLPTLS